MEIWELVVGNWTLVGMLPANLPSSLMFSPDLIARMRCHGDS